MLIIQFHSVTVYLCVVCGLVVSEEPADSWTSDTDPLDEDELTLAEEEGPSVNVAKLEALLSHPTLR